MSNQSKQYETLSSRDYRPGHPWYYKLGGHVPTPKEILNAVQLSNYPGYRKNDINQIDAKAEPARSAALRRLRVICLNELKSDLSIYREQARKLQAYRLSTDPENEDYSICDDPCMNMSLKYNHLYNGFAHLIFIDRLLSVQPDLFD